MSTLYVCSPAPGDGKTAIAIGLVQSLAAEGLSVGYLKPVGRGTTDSASDPDAVFARQALRLRLPLETLAPIDLNNAPADAVDRVRTTYGTASRGRDVVVVDGADDGAALGLGGPAIAALLDAKVLVVVSYQAVGLTEAIVEAARPYGQMLLGVVVNAVPETARREVAEKTRPALAAAGVPVVAALPISRTLLGLTVAELAAGLGGEIICAREWADKPVESFMLATISDTTVQWYFRRLPAKAVIARGDRPDAHIGALETETSCLIVTGGKDPQPHILGMAADLEVPIVKVDMDTMAVLDRVTDLLPAVRFRQRHKLPAIAGLLEEHFDFAALRRGLGLRQEATP